MTDLYDAVRALDERKRLLLGGEDGLVETDVVRLLLVGLDVDLKQLYTASGLFADQALEAIARKSVRPSNALTGGWVDGLITGLLLADMRAREPTP